LAGLTAFTQFNEGGLCRGVVDGSRSGAAGQSGAALYSAFAMSNRLTGGPRLQPSPFLLRIADPVRGLRKSFSLEELTGWHLDRRRELFEGGDFWVALSGLDPADLARLDATALGDFFLR
jgi:hypothetical protein